MKEINGDITSANVDAVVNAANPTLLGGGGVDGAIHGAAGVKLMMQCIAIPEINGVRCETGDAKITPAGALKAKYVIHTVGPVYSYSSNPELDLELCYKSCLNLAIDHGCKSIAFPAISTGVYGYPKYEAKKIAVSTCNQYDHLIDIYLYFF